MSAFSPAGFWTPAERRFSQLSLSALARTPQPARAAVEALARTRAGRTAPFWQTFGWPTRMPAEEAVATLRDAWAAPASAPRWRATCRSTTTRQRSPRWSDRVREPPSRCRRRAEGGIVGAHS